MRLELPNLITGNPSLITFLKLSYVVNPMYDIASLKDKYSLLILLVLSLLQIFSTFKVNYTLQIFAMQYFLANYCKYS